MEEQRHSSSFMPGKAKLFSLLDDDDDGVDNIPSFIGMHITSFNAIDPMQRAVLFSLFVIAIIVATAQVYKEYKVLQLHKQPEASDVETPPSAGDTEHSFAIGGADRTRSMFRRLLWVALILRASMLPFQGKATTPDEFCLQVVADTLPEMAFCSAWTLLVKFLVQLVGIATGENSIPPSPTTVIQVCAWVMYLVLVLIAEFKATGGGMLIYSLLAFIYTALFAFSVASGPRLLIMLKPSLARHSALAIRLGATCATCIFVYGARILGFCLTVISAGQQGPYGYVTAAPGDGAFLWWWNYGCLELFPSTLFLIMMHPRNPSRPHPPHSNDSTPTSTPPILRQIQKHKRTGSHGSSGNVTKQETAPLKRMGNNNGYGSAMHG